MVENHEKNTAEHPIDKNGPETDDVFEIINLSDLEPAVNEYGDDVLELSEFEGGPVKYEEEIVELSDITLTASSENGSILELTEEYRAGAPEMETTDTGDAYANEFSLDLEKTGEEALSFEDDAFFDLIEESDEETFGDLDDLDGEDLDLTGDEGSSIDLPEMSDEDVPFEDKSDFELTDEFDLTEEAQMAEFELDLSESDESGLETDDDAEIMEDDEFVIDEIEIEETNEISEELSDLLNDLDEEEIEFDLGDMLEPEAESESDSEAASIEITEEEEFSLDELFEEEDADVIVSETDPLEGLSEVAAFEIEAPTAKNDVALDKIDQHVEEEVDSLESELLEKLDNYFDTEDEEDVDPLDSGQVESQVETPVAASVESVQRDFEQMSSIPDGLEGQLVISPEQLEAALGRIIEKKFSEQIDKILNDIISQKISNEINALKSMIVNSMKDRA